MFICSSPSVQLGGVYSCRNGHLLPLLLLLLFLLLLLCPRHEVMVCHAGTTSRLVCSCLPAVARQK